MPRDTSSATLSTWLALSGPSRRTQSYTLPDDMYSNTMHRLGLRVHAPMNWTTFLWRTWWGRGWGGRGLGGACEAGAREGARGVGWRSPTWRVMGGYL